jgi:hypothetical protein
MRKDKKEQNEIARPAGKHFAQVDDSKAEPCCAESVAPASKVRKRLWAVAVLLCAVAIATGTYLTYTAFLAGDFLKSVAVSGTSQALFASDMLTGYTRENLNDGDIAVRSVIADTSGENCSFTFRIYNHLLGDKNKVNDKDVNATLSVEATGTTGTWSVKGKPTLTAGGTVDLSFPANKATMYTYKVTFSKADLNKASFTVKARVGSNSPGTNLKWLAAKIAPSERAEVTASGVSGEWVDKNKDDTNVGDFDAYNYRVTVTGATTKVELTWGSGVELDPFFEANHKNCVKQETVSGRSVTYDASPGSEIITFYRKGDSKPTSWEAIGVTCSAAKN